MTPSGLRRSACVFSVALFALAPLIAQRKPGPQTPDGSGRTALPFPVAKNIRFREIGPAISGGRVTAVAGVNGDPNVYYVGAADGGIFRTEDGGLTWTALFQHQVTAAIGALAVDPVNPRIVWAGTGEANERNDAAYGDGIYKSTDGGDHWTYLGLPQSYAIAKIAVDPLDHNVVYAAVMGEPWADNPHRGLYRTRDGGRTWKKVLYAGPSVGVADFALNPKNPEILYAATYRFRRTPWSYSDGGPEDAIYKSLDGGDHWRRLSGHGLPTQPVGRIGLAVAPSRPDTVYAIMGSRQGVLWRSDDAGHTWTLVNHSDEVDVRPFYFSHVAVDPKNPDEVFSLSMYLMESHDGGAHFANIAGKDHVDNHAIWIAPNGQRILEGNDGGAWLSMDGGRHWKFLDQFAIGQFYHVAANNQMPYAVCGGLQDNSSWCGVANSPDPQGILNRSWISLNGGDGMFAVPKPGDPNLIYNSIQNGVFLIYHRRTRQTEDIDPFPRDTNGMGIAQIPYRWNWDAGFAVSPLNGNTVYMGANVVFRSTDGGLTAKPISPDLTRNDKSKQQASGGPVIKDASGAEFYDTILSIAPSPKDANTVWVGTDDGLVWMTRDGGKHWTNVTASIPGLQPWSRIDAIDASPFSPGGAVIAVDRHFSGDLHPYLYRTTDFGRRWTSISGNLPDGDYAHVVRQDPVNPNLFYAGLENGLFVSWDAGQHWYRFGLGLPDAAVWDVQIEQRDDDLIVATHGRSLWVLDDLRPFQRYAAGKRPATLHIYRVRRTRRYWPWSTVENLGDASYYGTNAPYGALISYYVPKGTNVAGTLVIRNAQGQIVRTYKGLKPGKPGQVGAILPPPPNAKKALKGARARSTQKQQQLRTVPMPPVKIAVIPGKAGLQRVVWNLRSQPPVKWKKGLKAYNPKDGALVPPGTYTATLTFPGQSATATILVFNDPRSKGTPAEIQAQYALEQGYFHELSQIDVGLNRLDLIRGQVSALEAAVQGTPNQAAVATAAQHLLAAARHLQESLTSNPRGEEDVIRYPDRIREHVMTLEGFDEGWDGAPTPGERREQQRYNREYQAAMGRIHRFLTTDVATFNRALAERHLPGIIAGAVLKP